MFNFVLKKNENLKDFIEKKQKKSVVLKQMTDFK